MPRSPLGWALTIAVPALAVAAAFVMAGGSRGGGPSGPSAATRAAAVCQRAQAELHKLSASPQSVAAAVRMEHRLLAILGRELTDLEPLSPETNASFKAGLADYRSFLHEAKWMVERPDFVRLSLTLPDHPALARPWMKAWLAREQAFQREAQREFSDAGIPACERSLGSSG